MKLSEEIRIDGANIHDERVLLLISSYIPKIEKLENQIEKMKNCENCKYFPDFYSHCLGNILCINHSLWEPKK